jgi:hypothetical protein
MGRDNQPDLFQTAAQSVFGEDAPTPECRTDPDAVRAELYKILAEARAAQTLPWEPKTVLLYRTIFPQMTNWLPDHEGVHCALSSRRKSSGWRRLELSSVPPGILRTAPSLRGARATKQSSFLRATHRLLRFARNDEELASTCSC